MTPGAKIIFFNLISDAWDIKLAIGPGQSSVMFLTQRLLQLT
jgi:hypothetical protein